jgi:hypothetical protein
VQPGPQGDQDVQGAVVSGQRQAEHCQRREDVLVHGAAQGVAEQNEQILYWASEMVHQMTGDCPKQPTSCLLVLKGVHFPGLLAVSDGDPQVD